MPKPRESFSAGEATRITGVRYRNLDYWARTKLVPPSVAEASGTGTDRRYSFGDLVALRLAKELRDAGISTQALRKAIRFVRGGHNLAAESRLLAIGSTVIWVEGSDVAVDVLKSAGQQVFAFMFDLPRTVEEIKVQIRSLRAA